MARKELGPAAFKVAAACAEAWPGSCVVGVSGGADSLALALGAAWVAARRGEQVRAVIVDHQLQPGASKVASRAAKQLALRGFEVEVQKVTVVLGAEGLEAAARQARLAALAAPGLPVLLGHTLDDQAEQVFLGLVRGSGTRSIAGIPPRREQFVRPLLGIRRATTMQACLEWGIEPWQDPMNEDLRFTRVRVRRWLASLEEATGRDLRPNLARTAQLARADADALDELAAEPALGATLPVADLESLPDAIRWRRIKRWLTAAGASPGMTHVLAVDALVMSWAGQGPISLPGARVARYAGELTLLG